MRLKDPRLETIPERLRSIKEIVVFTSSKGGVGKTLISALTSLLLGRRGIGVGLLDLDVTNPTAHMLLGVDLHRVRPAEEKGVIPPEVFGVRFMSPVFFTMGRPTPLRGESACSAIREILLITRWVGVDVLVIDTPPGMGDELLEVLTHVKRFRAVVVTTPSVLALESAARIIEVLGPRVEAVVLNMYSGKMPQPAKFVEREPVVPVYTLPYDDEIEESLGDPERLVSTRISRETDRQLVNHIHRLVAV